MSARALLRASLDCHGRAAAAARGGGGTACAPPRLSVRALLRAAPDGYRRAAASPAAAARCSGGGVRATAAVCASAAEGGARLLWACCCGGARQRRRRGVRATAEFVRSPDVLVLRPERGVCECTVRASRACPGARAFPAVGAANHSVGRRHRCVCGSFAVVCVHSARGFVGWRSYLVRPSPRTGRPTDWWEGALVTSGVAAVARGGTFVPATPPAMLVRYSRHTYVTVSDNVTITARGRAAAASGARSAPPGRRVFPA